MKLAFDLHIHSCLSPHTMSHRLGTPVFYILGRIEFALRKFSASGCEFTRF